MGRQPQMLGVLFDPLIYIHAQPRSSTQIIPQRQPTTKIEPTFMAYIIFLNMLISIMEI
jgi:hypothetical protein